MRALTAAMLAILLAPPAFANGDPQDCKDGVCAKSIACAQVRVNVTTRNPDIRLPETARLQLRVAGQTIVDNAEYVHGTAQRFCTDTEHTFLLRYTAIARSVGEYAVDATITADEVRGNMTVTISVGRRPGATQE